MTTGAAHVAAVLLAAGQARRMGHNKLLAEIGGRPLVLIAAEAALASRAEPVIVVTGHQDAAVREALAPVAERLIFTHNPDHAAGMAGSLKTGIAALGAEPAGAVILLGDMPLVTPELIDDLIGAFIAAGAPPAVVPTHLGQWGNPVVIGRRLLGEVATLEGDRGARALIEARRARIVEWPVTTLAILADVDTPEALRRLSGDPVRRSASAGR